MLVTESTFDVGHLHSIAENADHILWVKGYIERQLCLDIAEKIKIHIQQSHTSGSAIYATDALPFYNALENDEKYAMYFSTSLSYMHEMRRVCFPLLSPADKVRLDLDEIWPYGAGVMDLNGRKMVFGIARLWLPGSEGLPHQDVLHRELPTESKTRSVKRQFGLNIYLTTPDQGGELEVWDRVIDDALWQSLGVPGSYGYSRDILPENSEVIRPEAGDLLIINTEYVHAIRPLARGDRITISGFMAYFGEARPLELWS
jgi:hypothetical protein